MGHRPAYSARFDALSAAVAQFEAAEGALPGLVDDTARDMFIEQVIDSEQRVTYFDKLRARPLNWSSADPADEGFDPLKAALLHHGAGNFDEAVWLTYLFVHFGRHRVAGWRYIRDIYGRLGQGGRWDWPAIAADTILFRHWLHDSLDELERPGPRGFGNHRKYESLNAWESTGTGEAVSSYVDWVLDGHANHAERFAEAIALGRTAGFDQLYKSMKVVARFGRIAKFDYLNTLRKLELLDVRPPHTYLVGATGPLRGARLLLEGDGGSMRAKDAQSRLEEFTASTGIDADVLEDAVCNWQKNPTRYVRFSG
jgi:hypothetical protein